MNEFSNVKLLSNPIKSLTFKTNVSKTEFEFHSRLWPSYFKLDEGVWCMTVGDVLVKNLLPTSLTTVFDVKTELVTGFDDQKFTYQKFNQPHLYRETYPQFVSNFQTIYSCQVSLTDKNDFELIPQLSHIWFTIDNAKFDGYRIFIGPRDCVVPEVDYKAYIEITLLFQRLK